MRLNFSHENMNKIHTYLIENMPLYRTWHEQSSHAVFQWAILLVVAGSVFFSLQNSINGIGSDLVASVSAPVFTCSSATPEEFGKKPDREKAEQSARVASEEYQILSQQFLTYRNTFGIQKVQREARLISSAASRKQYFIDAIRDNPDKAIFSILTPQERSVLRAITQNCVEEPTTVEGTLSVYHEDFFVEKTSRTRYTLTTDAGEHIAIHPARGLHVPLESRTRVRISGFRIDNELIFDGASSLQKPFIAGSGIDVLSQPGNPPVFGDQKTIVLMAHYQNTSPPTDPTLAQVQDTVFTQTNGYYRENSYNKISLSGNVKGWFSIPTNAICDISFIRDKTIAAADATVFFPNYTRLVIVIEDLNCGWGGLGTIGKETLNTADGPVTMSTAWIQKDYANLFVVGHELGHNFGNHHATFLNCGAVSIAPTGCTVVEYGDIYDIMGGGIGHFNAPHKEHVGWFDSSQIKEITANGRYTIVPIETVSSGIKAIKIKRGITDYLYAEYRQPIGYDTGFYNVYEGALLHIIPQTVYYPSLIDATPPGDANTPVVKVGATFTDPASNSKLTVVSKNSSGVIVDVILGKTEFTPPTVSLTAPANNATVSGSAVALAATASDNMGVAKVEFYGLYNNATTLIATDTTAPYTGTWNTIQVPNGSAKLYAKAYDTQGNIGESFLNTVTVANSDTVPPAVTLTSPADGSSVKNPVIFSATASDNNGVWRVVFAIFKKSTGGGYDPLKKEEDYTAPYKVSMSLSGNMYMAYAVAYDYAGNPAQTNNSYFTVLPDTTPPIAAIISPPNNTFIRGSVRIGASASDDVGVAKVEFFKDTDTAPFAFATLAPYIGLLDTKIISNGVHTLRAKAHDTTGNSGISSSISVTVDNMLPTVSLTAPKNGVAVRSNVTITASASDNIGIKEVNFNVDGVPVGKDATVPYSITWDSTTVADGSHTLSAKAVDMAGNVATALSVNVNVDNTSPSTPSNLVVDAYLVPKPNLAWNSSTDNVGVKGYRIERCTGSSCTNFAQIGTVSLVNSYTDISAVSGNTYRYRVRAVDAVGNVSGYSNIVTVTPSLL